jgi:hypothetical protein
LASLFPFFITPAELIISSFLPAALFCSSLAAAQFPGDLAVADEKQAKREQADGNGQQTAATAAEDERHLIGGIVQKVLTLANKIWKKIRKKQKSSLTSFLVWILHSS